MKALISTNGVYGMRWTTAGAVASVLGGLIVSAGVAEVSRRRHRRPERLIEHSQDWLGRKLETGKRAGLEAAEQLAVKSRKHFGRQPLGKAAGRLETMGLKAAEHLDLRREAGAVLERVGERLGSLLQSSSVGALVGRTRPYLKNVRWLIAGALFGAVLQVLDREHPAPLGLLRFRRASARPQIGSRLARHLLFGVATALAYELLVDSPPIRRRARR
ncbi:MAG TPA: hypothetical protein VFY39_07940 [Gammaproteobacteria bacterium]|nr:hypothetical protein [Gammaproteobacteria bacterium]